jgi:hypothetical protein
MLRVTLACVAGLLNAEIIASIASGLEQCAAGHGAVVALTERRDLEPAAVAAIGSVFPARAEKDRKVVIPYWEGVGRVDLIVRQASGSEELAAVVELKWCGPGHDILFEAIWDLFKMALGTQRDDAPHGYLITGAEKTLWEVSPFANLFENAEHDPAELCRHRLADAKQTLVWDETLRGGYDRSPEQVPARITTRVCGRSVVGEDWELRAVEVLVSSEKWIPMDGGWPYGQRPGDAKHPPLAPDSRFVDTWEDIQIDQATLPENIELMKIIDDQIAEAHEESGSP